MLPAVHRGAAQQLPLTRRRPTCANRLCRRTSWARALRTSNTDVQYRQVLAEHGFLYDRCAPVCVS